MGTDRLLVHNTGTSSKQQPAAAAERPAVCYPYLQRLLHRRLQLRRRRHAAIVCTAWRHTARQAQQCMTNLRAAGCRGCTAQVLHAHPHSCHAYWPCCVGVAGGSTAGRELKESLCAGWLSTMH